MEKREREFFQNKDEFDRKRRDYRNDHYNRGPKRNFGSKIVETKLFINKEELVEYANSKGQSSAVIEIFKIEDGLYKLVIKE